MRDIGRDMSASDFLCGASDSTSTCYTRVPRVSIKISDIYKLRRAERDCKSEGPDLGVTRLADRTFYVTASDDVLLPV